MNKLNMQIVSCNKKTQIKILIIAKLYSNKYFPGSFQKCTVLTHHGKEFCKAKISSELWFRMPEQLRWKLDVLTASTENLCSSPFMGVLNHLV